MLAIPVDRPIYSALNFMDDLKDARQSEDYRLENYLKNFEKVGDIREE